MSSAKTRALGIPLKYLAVVTVSLPFFGFLTSIIMSFIWNLDSSTYTHCEVENFTPSISSAIGSFVPQKYIWQACIALHTAPRFLFACLAAKHLINRLEQSRVVSLLIKLSFILQVVENFALLALTIVSSSENFGIHKTGFGTFVTCSGFYMIVTVYLVTKCGYQARNLYERKSLVWKKRLLKTSAVAVCFMLYFYWRHNEYCENYVYSFFCISEYIIVLSNMAFHMTSGYYDFYASDLVVTNSEIGYKPLNNVNSM